MLLLYNEVKATVKGLRQAAARKAERDIMADQGRQGELRLSMVGNVAQLNLSDPNDQQFKPLLPVLYREPLKQHPIAVHRHKVRMVEHLVAMHGNRMLFQGLTASREEGG